MDPFTRLGLPWRLDVAAGAVEDAVRSLAKSAHPDVGGDAGEFAEIGRAGELLKSPASRLKVALGLSGAEMAGRGRVPMVLMDFFSPVAAVLEEVGGFIAERGRARSALGRAMLDAKIPDLKRDLESLLGDLLELEAGQVTRFGGFDARGWESCVGEMEESYRALLFVGKWIGQLREATGKIFESLLAG